ncbi:3-phosphoshikimate 1-carboxyvinyltransferase [Chloroflexota bacterium]
MASKISSIKISSANRLAGKITLPGDKSISHRAVMLGSIADGVSEIYGISSGRDCLATINCLKKLGVKIVKDPEYPSVLRVFGKGIKGLKEPDNVLYAANSATTMRLMSGILAAQPFFSVINGDISLRERPMKRVIDPLSLMGAEIHGRGNDSYAPLSIQGKKLKGIRFAMPVPSAQIKSTILLAGLYAEGETIIDQPQESRDHTEVMLTQMGAKIKKDGNCIIISTQTSAFSPFKLTIPGDISSAAYWLIAAAIHSNASLEILNCGMNPTRTGIIDVLQSMGAKLMIKNQRLEGNEPIADLFIESSLLNAIDIDSEIMPRLIDEIPVIAVAACYARGKTTIIGAGELRVKESDRIKTTVRELKRLGADIEELPDGMVINGGKQLYGTSVKSYADHRLAMSLAVAGLAAKGETVIQNAHAAEISYPDFWDQIRTIST